MNFIIAVLLLCLVFGIAYILITPSKYDEDHDAIIRLYVQGDEIGDPRALSIYQNQTYKLRYKCFYKAGKLDLFQFRAVHHIIKDQDKIQDNYIDRFLSAILTTKILYIGDRKIIVSDVNKMPLDIGRSLNRLIEMTKDLTNMYMHQVCQDRFNLNDNKTLKIANTDRVIKATREGGDKGVD